MKIKQNLKLKVKIHTMKNTRPKEVKLTAKKSKESLEDTWLAKKKLKEELLENKVV